MGLVVAPILLPLDGPVAFGLFLVVLAPRQAILFAPAGVNSASTIFPCATSITLPSLISVHLVRLWANFWSRDGVSCLVSNPSAPPLMPPAGGSNPVVLRCVEQCGGGTGVGGTRKTPLPFAAVPRRLPPGDD